MPKFHGLIEFSLIDKKSNKKTQFSEQDRIINIFFAQYIDSLLYLYIEKQRKEAIDFQTQSFRSNLKKYNHEMLNIIQYIKINLEKAKETSGFIIDSDKFISSIDTLTNLIKQSNILELTEFEDFEKSLLKFKKENFDISKLIFHIIGLWNEIASDKNCHIITEIPEKLFINENHELFRIILQNLISNSIKYSVAGKEIILKLIDREDIFELSILNYVNKEFSNNDLEMLFLPESSVIIDTKERGQGLGLSITKTIIEGLHGIIWSEYYSQTKQICISFRMPKI